MKDQYFGDINDYRKYGLLRAIADATGSRIHVCWMLTPDDSSSDGKFIEYLDQPRRWAKHDPELFGALKALMRCGLPRQVRLIERVDVLPSTEFFSEVVPDQAKDRDNWFKRALSAANGSDIVFLDPDNGIEIQSTSYGQKNSSKFAYWREIEAFWSSGRSLLVYQHFPRETRPAFIARMLSSLEAHAPGGVYEAYSTANVLFLLALQPSQWGGLEPLNSAIRDRWKGQLWSRE